jgi:predicted enzyme related to lactoylglutathione lyase
MGERTKYTPGTFSWCDLTTTDPEAAKSFYGELFGWTMEDMPAGENMVYTMAGVDGKHVAALSAQPPQQRDAGIPPMWNSYITVASADDAVDRAKGLGATVHAPAFDVLDAGRMAVIQDPHGAFFEVWEPKQHIGAALVNGPGLLSWNELATRDPDGSAGFYSELFGWTVEPIEGMEMPYLVVKNQDGRSNGGIRSAAEQEPTYWLVYFGTDDLDGALAKADELGASKLMGPMEIGGGNRIAALQDPEGAVFALYAGQFEE